jgi:hypothetical protein
LFLHSVSDFAQRPDRNRKWPDTGRSSYLPAQRLQNPGQDQIDDLEWVQTSSCRRAGAEPHYGLGGQAKGLPPKKKKNLKKKIEKI